MLAKQIMSQDKGTVICAKSLVKSEFFKTKVHFSHHHHLLSKDDSDQNALIESEIRSNSKGKLSHCSKCQLVKQCSKK